MATIQAYEILRLSSIGAMSVPSPSKQTDILVSSAHRLAINPSSKPRERSHVLDFLIDHPLSSLVSCFAFGQRGFNVELRAGESTGLGFGLTAISIQKVDDSIFVIGSMY